MVTTMIKKDGGCGYDKDRFVDPKSEIFDCIICLQIANNPAECDNCGSMFCTICIEDWLKMKPDHGCPNRCDNSRGNIKPITGAMLKLYRNLDMKCRFPQCNMAVKLCELDTHEHFCQVPLCYNSAQCKRHTDMRYDLFKQENVCDEKCLLLKKLKESGGNWKDALLKIKQFAYQVDSIRYAMRPFDSKLGLTNFRWDPRSKGGNIKLSSDSVSAFLKEDSYSFRTIISDAPFYSGCHYWLIILNFESQYEMKFGVTKSKDFNLEAAFSDYEFGYSYYGTGQLRHNNKTLGASYGKKIVNEGKLGVFLDMNRGTLSFALNGEYLGVAFKDEKLKTGPIWPAVALIRHSGFSLVNNIEAPHYFIDP